MSEETTAEKRKRAPSKKFYAFDGKKVTTGMGLSEVAEALSANASLKIYEQVETGAYDLTAPTVNDKFKAKTIVSYQE